MVDSSFSPTAAAAEDTQAPSPAPSNVGGIAGEELRRFVERIERLEEEKAGIASDIKDVYAECKSRGFDTKIVRQVIKLRKMESQDRQEQEELLDLYLAAIGER